MPANVRRTQIACARQYEYRDDRRTARITVRLSRPIRKARDLFCCILTIEGCGSDLAFGDDELVSHEVFGADGMQALYLAMVWAAGSLAPLEHALRIFPDSRPSHGIPPILLELSDAPASVRERVRTCVRTALDEPATKLS